MTKRTKLWVAGGFIVGSALAGLLMFYMLRDKVTYPGNVENPKLAEIFNEEAKAWQRNNDGVGLLRTAQQGFEQFLREVRKVEVVYVRTSTAKFSHHRINVELLDGSQLSERTASSNCGMVARFELVNGIANRATTDGEEKKQPLQAARNRVRLLVACLSTVDRQRNPDRYYVPHPNPVQSEIDQQWQTSQDSR